MKNLSVEFVEYLYNFFVENKANICEYCRYNIKCSEECDCFEEFGHEAINEKTGKSYVFSNTFTCQNTEFGKCKKLENTPCNNCFENSTKHFEWCGLIPKDMETY